MADQTLRQAIEERVAALKAVIERNAYPSLTKALEVEVAELTDALAKPDALTAVTRNHWCEFWEDEGRRCPECASKLAKPDAGGGERESPRDFYLRTGLEVDNHHNALACPYCNPDGLVLPKPADAPDALSAEWWQPIATAPTDGRDILLRGGRDSGEWIRKGFWAKRIESWIVDVVGGTPLPMPEWWAHLPRRTAAERTPR